MRDEAVWTSSVANRRPGRRRLGGPVRRDLLRGRGCLVARLRAGRRGAVVLPRARSGGRDRVWSNRGDGSLGKCRRGVGPSEGSAGGGRAAVAGRTYARVRGERRGSNHWLVIRAAPGTPRYEDRAAVEGLAVDAEGISQACMAWRATTRTATARGFVFVTNFLRESNTLYSAVGAELFIDAPAKRVSVNRVGTCWDSARRSWMRTGMVWADHGGCERTHRPRSGEPFEMPSQFLRNTGGRFPRVYRRGNSAVFRAQGTGGGMARMDWNRDGLEDVVIVHQESPAALLELSHGTGGTRRGVPLRGHGCRAGRDRRAGDAACGKSDLVEDIDARRTVIKRATSGDWPLEWRGVPNRPPSRSNGRTGSCESPARWTRTANGSWSRDGKL